MRRCVVVLVYLLLWGTVCTPVLWLLGEILQTGLSEHSLSRHSLSEAIFAIVAVAAIIPAVVLPLCVFPFPLLVRSRKQGSGLRLRFLLLETPRAYMRCSKASCHATFTLCVLAVPPTAAAVLFYDIAVRQGAGSLAVGTATAANVFIWAVLGREILGRLTYPLLHVLIDRPAREALVLARELSTRRMLVITGYLILGTVGFIILASVHQTGTEIVTAPMYVIGLTVAWIAFLAFALSLILAQAAEERGRERLEWLLDSNVSPYCIQKLARAGYFF